MKGHVELVMISDENYWSVFVDGQYYDTTHHADYTDIVFRTGERNEIAKMAGVNVEDLRYSVYENFCYVMEDADPDYESCDYLGDYQAFATAVTTHKIAPFAFNNNTNASKITLEELEALS